MFLDLAKGIMIATRDEPAGASCNRLTATDARGVLQQTYFIDVKDIAYVVTTIDVSRCKNKETLVEKVRLYKTEARGCQRGQRADECRRLPEARPGPSATAWRGIVYCIKNLQPPPGRA